MQIRVDVDDQIDSSQELADRVEGVVEGSLERYRDSVVLVRVHLSRLVHHRSGERDMSCRMEAQAAGSPQPIVVTYEGITLTEAIHAASIKLERAVHDALKGRIHGSSGHKALDATDNAGPAGLGHVGSS